MQKRKGLVTKSTGSWYEVRTESAEIIHCRLRGQFRIKGIKNTNPIVVGDHVEFIVENDGCGYITDLEKRVNYIDRKSTKLSKISHLIAANIDQAFLVVTLKEPKTSLGFIDRFLLAAEGFRIPCCIVFNKIDLYNNEELNTLAEIENIYQKIGYSTLRTSTITGEGIHELKVKFSKKVCLFSGHSGVGKSALINAIDPSLHLKVGSISDYHSKGKHTTTFASMFEVSDGFVIDTPGIKEFGLIQYSPDEVRDYFPEIRQYNNLCRFNNCLHTHEPDCRVREAVEKGEIALSRYENYITILHDSDLQIKDWKLK